MAHFASWSEIVSENWPEEVVSVKRRAESEFCGDISHSVPKIPIPISKIAPRSLSEVTSFRMDAPISFPKMSKISDDPFSYGKKRQLSLDEMPFANLLPSSIQDLVDAESLQNFNTYAFSVKTNDRESAQVMLCKMIKMAKDKADVLKILRSAFDINKKYSKYKDALDILQEAISRDPQNITFPIESAKLMNDIGWFEDEDKILFDALKKTNYNTTLLSKMLKSLERRNMLQKARSILGICQKYNPESLFEGALFELRHGPAEAALFLVRQCEQSNIEWKGSVYLEIVEFCSRRGLKDSVLHFAEVGFKDVPSLFALCGFSLRFQNSLDDANKVYENSCEASQMSRPRLAPTLAVVLSQMGLKQKAHFVLAHAIALSPPEQKSRLFYNAALLCILNGEMQFAQMLLAKGKMFCQKKAQLPFDVLRAKIQEMSGYSNAASEANRIFNEIIKKYPDDWHSHFEFVLFLARQNHIQRARKALQQIFHSMPDNGRLLALKVQLETPEKQVETFIEAVHKAPKSGEVWLEGARIALNPQSPYFNLKDARFFLKIAHLFTPQYLDIFVEMCRLEMLENGIYGNFFNVQDKFINSEGNQGTVFLRYRILGKEFTKEEFQNMLNGVRNDLIKNAKIYTHAIVRSSFVPLSIREEMERLTTDSNSNISFKFGISSFGEKGNLLDLLGTSAAFLT